MSTSFPESLRRLVPFCVALWLVAPRTAADEARFFRVVGPTATTVTAFTPDGYITWTNAQVGTNYTVQTARSLGAATNWVDYIQFPASNNVVTHRLFDPNPPSGMVFIPPGSFKMGATTNMGHEYVSHEVPQHTVYVSGFYMDRHEVTKALWDEVEAWNGGNGYSYGSAGSGKAPSHPVYGDWWDCVKWCNARSQKEGLVPCYYNEEALTTIYKTGSGTPYPNWSANGYRLPTEAEWEKAARGGASGHRFPWTDSDDITHSRANYVVYQISDTGTNYYTYDKSPTSGFHPTFNDGVPPYTSPVGYFAPNGYGLYDMAGNIWELCWDWYSSNYYSSSPGTDPRGPTSGSDHLFRGGRWFDEAPGCRVAARRFLNLGGRSNFGGFRSVRSAGQ